MMLYPSLDLMTGKQLHPTKTMIGLINVVKNYLQFFPIGTKETKSNKTNDAVFKLYSRGYITGHRFLQL